MSSWLEPSLFIETVGVTLLKNLLKQKVRTKRVLTELAYVDRACSVGNRSWHNSKHFELAVSLIKRCPKGHHHHSHPSSRGVFWRATAAVSLLLPLLVPSIAAPGSRRPPGRRQPWSLWQLPHGRRAWPTTKVTRRPLFSSSFLSFAHAVPIAVCDCVV